MTISPIVEGMTGAQVADVIFTNDTELETAVLAIQEITGVAEETVLPTPTWMSQSWNSNAAPAGTVVVDTRCIVDSSHLLTSIAVRSSTTGTLRIGFYNTSTLVQTSFTDVAVTAGIINVIPLTFSDPAAHYVAIEVTANANVRLIFPNTGNTYGKYISGGALVTNNYALAYTITVDSTAATLAGRVTALEEEVGGGPVTDINAALAAMDVVTLGPTDYYLTAPVVMPAGKTLRGSFGKTRIFLNGQTTGIMATSVNDISISDLEIIGSKPNYSYAQDGPIAGTGYTLIADADEAVALTHMGTETGLKITTCERVALNNVKIRNTTGFAMHVIGVGKTYIWGMKTSNIFISDCYGGLRTQNEHEYSHYVNMSITLCQIGVAVASGNLQFTNISCTRGMVGMMYTAGTNHAHGLASSIEAKHNQIAGILCDSIQYGQFFVGVYLSYCDLIIRNSRGLFFSPAMFEGGAAVVCTGNFPDPSVPTDLGKNVISQVMCMYGNLSVSGGGNIIVQDAYNARTSV